MTNLRYQRGATFERTIKRRLIAGGYHVTRAAQSRGEEDLVATKLDRFYWQGPLVWYIQCKRRDTPDNARITHEQNDLRNLAVRTQVGALWVTLRNGRTEVQVLRSSDVSPDDELEIIDLIEKAHR